MLSWGGGGAGRDEEGFGRAPLGRLGVAIVCVTLAPSRVEQEDNDEICEKSKWRCGWAGGIWLG